MSRTSLLATIVRPVAWTEEREPMDRRDWYGAQGKEEHIRMPDSGFGMRSRSWEGSKPYSRTLLSDLTS